MKGLIAYRHQNCLLYQTLNVFISAVKLDWGGEMTDIERKVERKTEVERNQ